LVLSLAIALSSCSGDDTQVSAPVAPSPTATASPAEEPPPQPDPEYTDPGPAGAEAFVRYFNEVVNYAYRTGDVRQLRAVSAPECEACRRYLGTIERTYGARGRIVGAQRSILELQISETQVATEIRVLTTGDISATEGVDAQGKITFVEPSASATKTGWLLTRRGVAWRIKGVYQFED
jgi:hypothetical protein